MLSNYAECYVCAEADDTVLTNLCNCHDRPIHLHCQKKLLATVSKDGTCTVCKTVYKNIRVRKKIRINYGALSLKLGYGMLMGLTSVSVLFLLAHAVVLMEQSGKPLPFCAMNCTEPLGCDLLRQFANDTSRIGVPVCFNFSVFLKYGLIVSMFLIGLVLIVCLMGLRFMNRFIRSRTSRIVEHEVDFFDVVSDTRAPDAFSLDVPCAKNEESRPPGTSDSADTIVSMNTPHNPSIPQSYEGHESDWTCLSLECRHSEESVPQSHPECNFSRSSQTDCDSEFLGTPTRFP